MQKQETKCFHNPNVYSLYASLCYYVKKLWMQGVWYTFKKKVLSCFLQHRLFLRIKQDYHHPTGIYKTLRILCPTFTSTLRWYICILFLVYIDWVFYTFSQKAVFYIMQKAKYVEEAGAIWWNIFSAGFLIAHFEAKHITLTLERMKPRFNENL